MLHQRKNGPCASAKDFLRNLDPSGTDGRQTSRAGAFQCKALRDGLARGRASGANAVTRTGILGADRFDERMWRQMEKQAGVETAAVAMDAALEKPTAPQAGKFTTPRRRGWKISTPRYMECQNPEKTMSRAPRIS